MNHKKIEEIIHFWFGDLPSDSFYPKEQADKWFSSSPEFDAEIKKQFSGNLEEALSEKLYSWKESPKGSLAFILLLDQFTRNIFRNSPKAFEHDPLALEVTLSGIKSEQDLNLLPIQRVFFYLPLEHSEDISIQEKSVRLFEKLIAESPKALNKEMTFFHQYAVSHYDIIKRFGRFPHRNKILNRESTPEEIDFLKEPGSSF